MSASGSAAKPADSFQPNISAPQASTKSTQSPEAIMSAQEMAKGTGKDELRAQQAKSQCDNFRCRINSDARAMMEGRWNEVKKPYKPQEVKDEKSMEWRTQVNRQNKINAWVVAAKKTSKETGSLDEARYHVLMEMRKDSGFADVSKKYPEPQKPASLTKKPEPASASLPVTLKLGSASSPATLKRNASGGKSVLKQEIIDVDEDDEEPVPEPEQSDYDPEDDAAMKREERAKKRQRTGDSATKHKQSASEEDLEFQLQESRLKAQLAEVGIRRKIAAAKRKAEGAQ